MAEVYINLTEKEIFDFFDELSQKTAFCRGLVISIIISNYVNTLKNGKTNFNLDEPVVAK